MQPTRNNRKLQAIPLYKRIEQDIRRKIQSGQWKLDTPLPGRLKLAAEYGVALPTIERAIDLLIEDGVLRAEGGRGTYIAIPPSGVQQSFDDHTVEIVSPPITPLLGIVAAEAPLDIPVKPRTETDNWDQIVVSSLERTFSKLGGGTHYAVRYHNGIDLQPSLEDSIRDLLAYGVTAITVVQIYDVQRVTDLIFSLFDPEQIPVVLLSWENIASPLPHVTYDNRCAGYKAAQHLLQAGYQRLLFLDLSTEWWCKERLRGAQTAVRNAQLPAETLQIYRGEVLAGIMPAVTDVFDDEEGKYRSTGYRLGKAALAEGFLQSSSLAPLFGVIAPMDTIALGFLQAIVEAGKVPGGDVGVVGFDDRQDAGSVGLTTLRPPLEEMGEAAAQLLMARLQGQQTPSHVKICSDLLTRSSTRRR